MARVITPHRLTGDWDSVAPLINDNFEKMVTNAESFLPIDTTEASCGGYVFPNYLLAAVSIVFDLPDYDNYAAFLPQYDIYVDHPVSTGTIAINNTAGSGTVFISIGDRFIANEDTAFLAGDARARYWYATASTSVLAGASGSVACIAEAPGTRYNKTSYQVYTASSPSITTKKFLNLYPAFGGSGGAEATVYRVTSTGGSDTPDTTYQWPLGSNVTANMAKLSIGSHLSITADPGSYTTVGEDERTDPKAIATLSLRNEDVSTHSYYIRAKGVLLSGKS